MRRGIVFVLLVVLAAATTAPATGIVGSESPDGASTVSVDVDDGKQLLDRPEWAAPLQTTLPSRQAVDEVVFNEQDIGDRMVAYNYSYADAVLRMRIEEAAMGVGAVLRAAHPQVYAGVWISDDGGPSLTVAIKDTGSRHEDVHRTASAVFAYPERIAITNVEYSLVELEQLNAAAIDATQERPEWATSVVVGIDIVDNAVDVMFGDDALGTNRTASVSTFESTVSLGSSIEALTVSVGLTRRATACVRALCQWTMIGGLAMDHASDICTSGFGLKDGSGNEYVTVAGHCGNVLYWWKNHTWGHYGQVTAKAFQNWGIVDSALIPHSSNPWSITGFFFGNNESDLRPVASVTCGTCFVVGQWNGSSGRHGTTKGALTHVGVMVSYDGVSLYSQNLANFCNIGWPPTQFGDSGGPIFRNNAAVGSLGSRSACDFSYSQQRLVEFWWGRTTYSPVT